MRLTNVLLAEGTQANTLFPTMTGPIAPLTRVLDEIRTQIRHHTEHHSFERELARMSGGEMGWLQGLMVAIAGHQPPFVIGRIPHKTPSGVIRQGYHDLHVFVGKPLSLYDALAIATDPGNDGAVHRNNLEQYPLTTRQTTPWTHVTAQLYDNDDPNTAHYPMLSLDFADCLDEILHALAPDAYPLAERQRRLTTQLPHILLALREWHLSLSLAHQAKIGLSSLTARVLALNSLQTISGSVHNAFNFAERHLAWKRDFQIQDGQHRPAGGFKRLADRRRHALSGWIRYLVPADLVDGPLPQPLNRQFDAAAKAYADHLDGEVWTKTSSPDESARPLRPIAWPHTTQVGKVGHATAGAVLLSRESNILETIIVLEEPAAIITERFAIIAGEIPETIAEQMIGQPFTRIVDHPLLAALPGTTTQLTVKAIEPLIAESANQFYNQAAADRKAWEALHQHFALGRRDIPAFLVAMGMSPGSKLTKSKVPGCTLVKFHGKPILGDTPLGTIEIDEDFAAVLKRAIDFQDLNK